MVLKGYIIILNDIKNCFHDGKKIKFSLCVDDLHTENIEIMNYPHWPDVWLKRKYKHFLRHTCNFIPTIKLMLNINQKKKLK